MSAGHRRSTRTRFCRGCTTAALAVPGSTFCATSRRPRITPPGPSRTFYSRPMWRGVPRSPRSDGSRCSSRTCGASPRTNHSSMSWTSMPATDPDPAVSVVVPVFRNATHLAELATQLDRALAPRSYELIFVDDASPDGARAEIERLAARDGRIGAIFLTRNVGQNGAILAGLARALGEAVVV